MREEDPSTRSRVSSSYLATLFRLIRKVLKSDPTLTVLGLLEGRVDDEKFSVTVFLGQN